MVKIIVSLKNKLDEFFTSSQNVKRKKVYGVLQYNKISKGNFSQNVTGDGC